MKTTNIYVLIDPISEKIRYVGKANNVKQRHKAHLNRARKHQTHKKAWIELLRKKGLKPIFKVIDVVPINEWQFWEIFWISQCRSWGFDLVNHTNGGDGCSFSNQTSFKKGQGGKRVVGFNKDGKIVYEFETTTEASNYFNLNRKTISSCCNKNNPSKTIKGLAWFYKEDINNLSEKELLKQILSTFVRNKTLKNFGEFKKGCKSLNSKKVLMYDLDWNFIKEFESAKKTAQFLGVTGGAVQFACTKSKQNKCKNYKFKYK